jgi:hypothetical protein
MQTRTRPTRTRDGQPKPAAEAALEELARAAKSGASLSPQLMAALLGCSPSSLLRIAGRLPRTSEAEPSALQAFLLDLLGVLSAAYGLTGSASASIKWVRRAQIREFHGRSPLAVVAKGRGHDVCRLLEMYEAGPAG